MRPVKESLFAILALVALPSILSKSLRKRDPQYKYKNGRITSHDEPKEHKMKLDQEGIHDLKKNRMEEPTNKAMMKKAGGTTFVFVGFTDDDDATATPQDNTTTTDTPVVESIMEVNNTNDASLPEVNDQSDNTNTIIIDLNEEYPPDDPLDALADDNGEPEEVDIVFGSLHYAGNDGWYYSRYPMGVCQGDCDSDDDCQPGLYCYNREGTNPVPHCYGGETWAPSADYCTWDETAGVPSPEARQPEMPEGVFRLKLYWEEGYLWQNETFDRKWCMIADYDGYPGNGECWYGRELRDCLNTQLYIGKCLDDDQRQWFTMIDLGTTYSTEREVMFQTAGDSGPKRCMVRDGNQIFVTENCDPENQRQRWYALRGSFTPGELEKDRFELAQNGFPSDRCVTNAHHPKSGEVVEFHNCVAARSDDDMTSYWNFDY